MKAIELINVSKEFPSGDSFFKRNRILDNISFEVEMGENVAIIGPNGCGKTTLLKTMASIYMPDEGTIRIFGNDMARDSGRARSAFSFVSPSLNFQNKLTLRQTLRFFCGSLGTRIETVLPFLKKLGIMHMLDTRLEGFSEGQKAMVRLAIGLIKAPRILLLDEIVANLDVARKDIVIDFIDELDASMDVTVVIIDHDPRVVDRLCKKIVILTDSGTLYKITTVEDLMKSLPYTYTVSATCKSDMDITFLEETGWKYKLYNRLVRFFVAEAEEALDVIKMLMKLDNVLEINTSGITLEDVYYLMRGDELK